MSLFPAYAGENATPIENDRTEIGWLALSSFTLSTEGPQTGAEQEVIKEVEESERCSTVEIVDSSSDSVHRQKGRGKKKKRKNKSRDVPAPVLKDVFEEKTFVVDKTGENVFLKVDRIYRPAVSKYKYLDVIIGNVSVSKRRHKYPKRYYNSKYLVVNENEKGEEKEVTKETDGENVQQNKAEENISKKTGYYNQSLGKDPFNVDMWLEYVKFQDTVWQFEKTHRKGSIAKGVRVTAERKLAILDKALTHNPNNEMLTRERVLVAERVYPLDELSAYLRNLVEKNPGNVILWQGYIEATQCSMAHCNTPAVIDMYNKCLTKLHQLRRSSSEEKYLLEEKILCMLYQCGLFLRQAGLWEQMWTLLRLYLELTLASNNKSKFNISSRLDDQQLVELEEVVLESQLPLHELWLRVEKLRESCHWLPWSQPEPCEDPQRVVFNQDVADLIHPITSTGHSFRLTVMILTLLKVPLLPCRHSTIQELGLDYVPWSLDSIETLYPLFFPLHPVNLTNEHLLKDAVKLAVGPQYLKIHPGQEEYLNFLITLMTNCGDCLQSTEQTAIFVWWLRFERLLIVLNKLNRFKMPTGRQKQIKSLIKKFLMEEQNRNNVVYYKEYALIEYELGNFESACKILKTSITAEGNNHSILSILSERTRTTVCSLYRTLVEIHLNEQSDIETNRQKALTYLIELVMGNLKTDQIITNEIIEEAIDKFKHLTVELLQDSQTYLSVSEHFLPDLMIDWVICYGWLLYLSRTPYEAGAMVENILKSIEQKDVLWRKEVLMEWYVTLLYKTCTEQIGSGNYVLFNDVLHRALTLYPNNLYLLAVASKEQSVSACIGPSWWKLCNLLSSTGHAMPALFLVIMANQQLSKTGEESTEFDISGTMIVQSTFKNRMMALFMRLTKLDICTKRCGLLWRLYLEYLYNYSDSESCRKAYYAAVEECPWLKALYIDAAIYIPAELPQIQDLIIEKQLRIHVTPEELDVLRS